MRQVTLMFYYNLIINHSNLSPSETFVSQFCALLEDLLLKYFLVRHQRQKDRSSEQSWRRYSYEATARLVVEVEVSFQSPDFLV